MQTMLVAVHGIVDADASVSQCSHIVVTTNVVGDKRMEGPRGSFDFFTTTRTLTGSLERHAVIPSPLFDFPLLKDVNNLVALIIFIASVASIKL
jgi:hypothetical protein